MWRSQAVTVLVVACALGALSGCIRKVEEGRPLVAPPPRRRVNAVMPENWRSQFDRPAAGDTTVLARCHRARRYAVTRQGDRDFWWYVIEFLVLRVERGKWSEERLSFVCSDVWAVRGSGFYIRKAPYTYLRGRLFAFRLDTTKQPARIVGQERRSYLPPHGRAIPWKLDVDKPAGRKTFDRVKSAVREFEKRKILNRSEFPEETGRFYIVERGELFTPGGKLKVLLIDKKTYEVKRLEIK